MWRGSAQPRQRRLRGARAARPAAQAGCGCPAGTPKRGSAERENRPLSQPGRRQMSGTPPRKAGVPTLTSRRADADAELLGAEGTACILAADPLLDSFLCTPPGQTTTPSIAGTVAVGRIARVGGSSDRRPHGSQALSGTRFDRPDLAAGQPSIPASAPGDQTAGPLPLATAMEPLPRLHGPAQAAGSPPAVAPTAMQGGSPEPAVMQGERQGQRRARVA